MYDCKKFSKMNTMTAMTDDMRTPEIIDTCGKICKKKIDTEVVGVLSVLKAGEISACLAITVTSGDF